MYIYYSNYKFFLKKIIKPLKKKIKNLKFL